MTAIGASRIGTLPAKRQRMFLPLVALLSLLILVLVPFGSRSSAQEDEYRLGIQDKVRLKVYEWRASRDEIYEWVALNTEYVVGASGRLTLPLIGEVAAAGRTPKEVSKVVGEKLRVRIGLLDPPDVAIEVTQYRPIYLVGQVEKPGEYPYRPGMTLLQAISLSGGHFRGTEAGLPRLEREVISAKGELDLLAYEHTSLLARKARLEAELKRADSIVFPTALLDRAKEPSIKVLMEQEQQVFQARKGGVESQVSALKQLQKFLEREVASLATQLSSHDKQVLSLKEEQAAVSTLAEKGLATAPRRMAMERSVAALEGDHLRLETGLLRARQELSRTEISIIELLNRRTGEVTIELQQTQLKLDQINQRTETSEKLLYESEVIAPHFVDRNRSARGRIRYTIYRPTVDNMAAEVSATETTLIQPGDTIKVEIPTGVEGALAVPRDPLSRPPQFSQDILPSRIAK